MAIIYPKKITLSIGHERKDKKGQERTRKDKKGQILDFFLKMM
jgi:hypothetical protein